MKQLAVHRWWGRMMTYLVNSLTGGKVTQMDIERVREIAKSRGSFIFQQVDVHKHEVVVVALVYFDQVITPIEVGHSEVPLVEVEDIHCHFIWMTFVTIGNFSAQYSPRAVVLAGNIEVKGDFRRWTSESVHLTPSHVQRKGSWYIFEPAPAAEVPSRVENNCIEVLTVRNFFLLTNSKSDRPDA